MRQSSVKFDKFVSAYRSIQPSLKNPINDADDMARALESLGFRVVLSRNASLVVIQVKVEEFANLLEHAKVGLVYFAGHGLQSGGVNYLVPVDARLASAADIPKETLSSTLAFLSHRRELIQQGIPVTAR